MFFVESLISPSPRLLLKKKHNFSVKRDSSDMYKRLYMDIYFCLFFPSVLCPFLGHGELDTIPAAYG